MPDSEAQARTSTIMRFPQPHHPDGRPWHACRPIIPDPSRPGPPHPDRSGRAAGRRRPAPAGLPGRRPGRRPVDRRDRRVGRRRAPASAGCAGRPPCRSRPLGGAGRGHHPPYPFPPGSRRAGRRHRRLAGRPGPDVGARRGRRAAGRGRRRQDAARRPPTRRGRPPGAPAGGDGTCHPRGAGPASGRRRPRGGHRLRPAAGRARPCRGHGHHRCAPDPPGGRRVPGGRETSALPVYSLLRERRGLDPALAPVVAAGPGYRSYGWPGDCPRRQVASNCPSGRRRGLVWRVLAIVTPLVLLAYLALIDFANLYPWNDTASVPKRERIRDALLNYPPLVIASIAFLLDNQVLRIIGLVHVVVSVLIWVMLVSSIVTFITRP